MFSRLFVNYHVCLHYNNLYSQIYLLDYIVYIPTGVWHFSFADMSYATRLVAKTIFGSPPTSTYEQALHYFLRAEQISVGFYSTNTYYIGEVYDRLGKKDDAIEHYRKSFMMPVISADDEVIHQKVKRRFKNTSTVCD
uniref:Regulator of microtubule dynamics protein 1 n=1 Tax=Heterorhabditis bacteriophora TaxID=37862 RepID=A0A1I7WTM2_HETBA